MKPKPIAALSMVLFIVGAACQFVIPSVGAVVIQAGILAALGAVAVVLRSVSVRLVNINQKLMRLQQSVTWGNQETVKYGNSIFSRVREYTNNLDSSRASNLAFSQKREAPSAGRVSTPEVSNPFTRETLRSMTEPRRKIKVAGLYDVSQLPDHEALIFVPGEVIASLDQFFPDLVVIDENVLNASPIWRVATSSIGASMMLELVSAQKWAKSNGVQAVLLTGSKTPDVFVSSLRNENTSIFPLTKDQMASDFGAAHTLLFENLQNIALEREDS